MPIRTQMELPVRGILEQENIFVMDENRAMHQDIRPLEIGILNLMPLKEDTELQILRMLSNTPLQVDVRFFRTTSHDATHTAKSHLMKFYETFEDIKTSNLDGLIITGAPVELMDFEDVDYWDEIVEIMDWTRSHVTSTLHLCWGAQAGLYYHYGIKKRVLDSKVFGVFTHQVKHRRIPLVRGFDDEFLAPHSRYTDVDSEEIRNNEGLITLADSDEVGVFLCMSTDGRQVFVMGHPEYDRLTLDKEYKRDKAKGLDIALPKNYYPGNDPINKPLLSWRGHANTLYTNWLNYYVYQLTPYDFADNAWGEFKHDVFYGI